MDEARRRWQEAVARASARDAATGSGLSIELLYAPDAVDPKIGYPGQYPFTRGVHPTMYRGRLWTMRQYAGFGTAEDTNQRFKWLLEQGETGLSVAGDLPSQMGYDSDDPDVEEEVGRVGVAVSTLDDMAVIFDGIPLDQISTSFTINGTAAIWLAMYLAVAEMQGVPWSKLTGTMQNDILKEYVARGTWIYPPGPSLRLIVDTIEFCSQQVPRFNAISVAGAHFRDAGATAAQEMAYTLADGIAYIQACRNRGLDVDAIGAQISFFFYTHMGLFEEVAKYRAGRRLWARIMGERFGASSPKSLMFRCGCVCGGSSLTAQQPMNNIVRVAYEALASVLGGVQSMFTCAYDEAFALPTAESAELALRTQQVLAFESGVADTVDPLGGSWFVESLTDAMEAEIERVIARIDQLGGMVRCIEDGTIQREVAREAYAQQRRVEAGQQAVVGVNRFASPEPRQLSLFEADATILRRQVERLVRVRAERDAAGVQAALAHLRQAAEGTENLMGPLIAAVKARATLGEINRVLVAVFGTFREPVAF